MEEKEERRDERRSENRVKRVFIMAAKSDLMAETLTTCTECFVVTVLSLIL